MICVETQPLLWSKIYLVKTPSLFQYQCFRFHHKIIGATLYRSCLSACKYIIRYARVILMQCRKCIAIKSFLLLVFPRQFFPGCLYSVFCTESASQSTKQTVMRILSRKRPMPETRVSVTIVMTAIDKPSTVEWKHTNRHKPKEFGPQTPKHAHVTINCIHNLVNNY